VKRTALYLIGLAITFPVDAALVGRLADENGIFQAYYDPAANLTWLADANAAGGGMTWVEANTWAANLDISGVTGWRLPTTLNPDNSCENPAGSYGWTCTGSEMGNLFANVLGSDLTNGPFINIQTVPSYWSATEYSDIYAWSFQFGNGRQNNNTTKTHDRFAWAVYEGDVTQVPIPASILLLGSGLLGLVGVSRRKKTK
jgi:hypothetical protein